MKNVEIRWQEGIGKQFVDRLGTAGRSGNGVSVSESPFGATAQGILDFRGLRFHEKSELRRLSFAPSDFRASVFKGIWLERCVFSDSVFEGASFQKVAEHGSTFRNCNFLKSSFRDAVIGFRGTRFDRCTLDSVDFHQTGFIRPEFDDCAFHRCKLDGCDLNGASFERCRFVGVLNEVWFRGGFGHPNEVERYGQPRRNRMLNVSFESAVLHDVTFSNQCDLSTVHPPTDDRHALLGNWPTRLSSLQEQCASWPENQQRAAKAFASTNLVHAQTQDWFLLNRDDLQGEFGEETANRIWQAIIIAVSDSPPSPTPRG